MCIQIYRKGFKASENVTDLYSIAVVNETKDCHGCMWVCICVCRCVYVRVSVCDCSAGQQENQFVK